MKLTWVNHASFILNLGSCRLICDPWLGGTAFNNSWNLLSPTKFTYEDFRDITHIWFSHEHPDHFSPPNLREIPPQYRQRITVLFHQTKDHRLINVCKSLGFVTQEMPPEEWMHVGDAALLCGRHGQLDSWLAVRQHGTTLLNMNDCFYRSAAALKRVANHVFQPDVLLTQFSYANWVGNPDDLAAHRAGAQEKIDEITRQARTLQPRMLVPCASFVWFSHEENYFMNRSVNRIERIYDYCTNTLQVPTVVLYPGDEWEVGRQHDSSAALARYVSDFDEVLAGKRGLIRPETRSRTDLQRAAERFLRIFRVASLNSSGDRVNVLLLARKAVARAGLAA